jgi:hypothetical protein
LSLLILQGFNVHQFSKVLCLSYIVTSKQVTIEGLERVFAMSLERIKNTSSFHLGKSFKPNVLNK